MGNKYWLAEKEGDTYDNDGRLISVAGWQVTDGIWTSAIYPAKADAEAKLRAACWGEGVNTI